MQFALSAIQFANLAAWFFFLTLWVSRELRLKTQKTQILRICLKNLDHLGVSETSFNQDYSYSSYLTC